MPPSKEFQAFTSLIDKLLKVPKDEIVRREAIDTLQTLTAAREEP